MSWPLVILILGVLLIFVEAVVRSGKAQTWKEVNQYHADHPAPPDVHNHYHYYGPPPEEG